MDTEILNYAKIAPDLHRAMLGIEKFVHSSENEFPLLEPKVVGFLVGLYYGATALEAASETAAESGVALSLSAATISALGSLEVGYLAALVAA